VATSTSPEATLQEAKTAVLARTTLPYFSTEAVNALATIGGVAAFTRLVPPAVYGEFAVVLAGSGFVMAVAGEWLQVTALRFAGRGPNRPVAVSALLQLLVRILTVLAMVALVGLALLPASIDPSAILVGAALTCLTLAFLTLTACFQGNLESWRFASYRSAFAVMRIALPIGVVLLWQRSAFALVSGQVLAVAILLPMVLYHVLEGRGHAAPGAIRTQRRAMLAFGGPLVGWYAASQLLNLSDRFFLQAWRGSEEVGQYAVSYALVMGAVATTLQPILAALYPLMVRSWHRGGALEAQSHFDLVVRLFLVLAPGLWGMLWFLGNDFLAVIAPAAYQTPRVVLGCLAGGILCWYGGLYIQKALELDLRSRSLVRILWVAALVNLGANLLLIPEWGLLGASVSTLLGYAAYVLMTLWAARRSMSVTPPPHLLVSAGMAFCVLAGMGFGVEAFMGNSSHWARVLIGTPLVAGAYLATILARGEHRVGLAG